MLNAGSVDLEVLSVSTDNVHFHGPQFKPITLSPGARVNISVLFLPRLLGPVNSTMRVSTSTGVYVRTMTGHGVESPYRVAPLLGVSALSSQHFRSPCRSFSSCSATQTAPADARTGRTAAVSHGRREGGGTQEEGGWWREGDLCRPTPHHITHTHTWSSLPHTRSRRAATATTPRGPAASACCAAGPCARRGVLPPSDPNLQPARGRAPRRQGDLHLRVLYAPRHAGRRRRAAPQLARHRRACAPPC